MLNLRKLLLPFLAIAMCFSGSVHGDIVIGGLNQDVNLLPSASTGQRVRGRKATGDLSRGSNQGNARAGDLVLSADFDRSKGKNKKSEGRSAGGQMLRYSPKKRSAGGGGSGGGGSGGQRSSSRRRSGAYEPQIVDINNHGPVDNGSQGPNDGGTKLDIYPNSGGSGSPGGGSGSGGNPTPKPVSENPEVGAGLTLSGTPEPAALAVWAIVGCCGYGIARFRQRWTTES